MRPIVSLGILCVVVASGAAAPQSVIFGESPAAACFRHASSDRSDLAALRDCDIALSGLLTRRDRAATYANRGIIKLNRDQPEAALEDFAQAERAGLSDIGALAVNRSSAYLRLNRYREALEATEVAIAAGGPDAAAAWFNRAVALEALDELAEAYHAYRQAQALRPDWPMPAQELERFRRVPGS